MINELDPAPVGRRFLTVRQASQIFTWPEAGLRHLIFTNPNSFRERVLLRIGRKILICEASFVEWLRDRREGSK